MGATIIAYGKTTEEVERSAETLLREAYLSFRMMGQGMNKIRPIRDDEMAWVPSEWRRHDTLVQWIRVD